MATVGQLNINGEGTIGNLLINRKLSVPFYQRSYSWQEKQVSEFFHDLDYSIRHHEAEYFLGSLVMTQSDDAQPADVVDGQQRIATAMILLAAWRDLRRASPRRKSHLAPPQPIGLFASPVAHLIAAFELRSQPDDFCASP